MPPGALDGQWAAHRDGTVLVTGNHRSVSRCFRPWNDPTGRANRRRPFTYATVISRHFSAIPRWSEAIAAAPALAAAWSAPLASAPGTTERPGVLELDVTELAGHVQRDDRVRHTPSASAPTT